MEVERQIRSYFKQQVRSLIDRSTRDPEGCLSYFADHEPKDEEILGLLAVNTPVTSHAPIADIFPTTFEALAALSPARQSEICREFRKELKHCLRQINVA